MERYHTECINQSQTTTDEIKMKILRKTWKIRLIALGNINKPIEKYSAMHRQTQEYRVYRTG